jgi:hypothetical protein
MNKWKYFGRSGATGNVFEIYRIPANDKPFHAQSPEEVTRLKPNGDWAYDPNDNAILAELLKGDFNEVDDELTTEEVNRLYHLWITTQWPGRK